MHIVRAVALMVAVALAGGCSSKKTTSDPKPDDRTLLTVPIVELIHGDISGLDSTGVFLIKSSEDLASHGSATLAAINVDFEHQALVVLSLGQQPTGGYWARITDIMQLGDTLIVSGKANRPSPDDMVTQVVTTPYCVAVIDMPSAQRVRSDVASVTGEQPPAE